MSEDLGLLLEPHLVSADSGETIERRRLRPGGDGSSMATFSPPPGVGAVEARAAQATVMPVQREAVLWRSRRALAPVLRLTAASGP
ncbi:hypothetical protein [Streptomyces sp. NPDC001307]|uniref:hypothetical protein n=1 Tax=Streptomyces sp. NPDC001307 TaxID=3364560 RepID=UPI0036935635